MTSKRFFLALLLLVLVAPALGAAGDPAVAAPDSETPAARIVVAPIPDVQGYDGAKLYATLCADCHGERGAGDGRFAAKLGKTVPDLTRLADENGYDRPAVRRDIAKCTMVPSPDAQTWGDVLVGSYGQAQGQRMLSDLARYLATLQAAPQR